MHKRSRHAILTLLIAGALVIGGCAETEEAPETAEPGETPGATPSMQAAVAELEPTEGNETTGRVTFQPADEGEGLHVIAEVRNLSEGEHGFHVHENGDCSAPDASSAGGHYAPNDNPHGAPDDPWSEHHTGDMGNITADGDGVASLDETFDFLSLEGDTSIVGKAVIVHQGEDDLTSQPSGDAGDRLACGVVELEGEAGPEGEGNQMGEGQTMEP